MASKNHQIGIEINADVKGQESIADLTHRLDDAAKVLGGELKVKAQQAAAELRELGAQDAAIKAFRTLKQEASDSARALKSIEGEVASFGKQISAVGPPTAREAAELQKLQAAASAVSAKLAQQNQALGQATADMQRFGVASNSTQAAQQRLTEKTQALRDSVKDLVPAYQSAGAGAAKAAAEQNRSHRDIKDGVSSISEQLALVQKAYVGLQAAQGAINMVKGIAETADAYNNLQARIKLVTGEGAAFQTAFEGVGAVAQRTSSSLESTGNLFSKLAQAGKDMGVGQAEALALTETVNQAVQLSGASAQASDAAITQLIQGLQGGVLRGDEFNSVMEQSPRLAKTLADGLGVTTGELRKMAEAGQLSSDTVIKALRGQADTVASEFSKLPPTVGRAIQQLSNSWTLYVGETDKATGASSAAATVISALSNNLSTVAGYLIDAGQAAAAFAALRLAQHFTGIATAATASTTAVVANTAAMNGAAVAGAGAAAGVGRFASILSSLKLVSLIGIVTNFHDIGTAIGEGAAKLMGYKDRTKELEQAEKELERASAAAADARRKMAEATQAAIEKQFGLTKAGAASIAEFDKLTKGGASAAKAIADIGKDFDLSTVPGIRDAGTVLNKLLATGKITAEQFRKAWNDALKGQDLAEFEEKSRKAFAGTTDGILRVGQALDASLRESIKRTGLDFVVISGGMSKASVSAINDTEVIIKGLARLKAQGVDTGQALTASISKGIDTADSQKAIEAVRKQIESVRKVLGDKVADGLLDQAKTKSIELTDALSKVKPGINDLREAMQLLGLKSREELQSTAKKAEEAYAFIKTKGQEEGESYVAWQARKTDAARVMLDRLVAANGGVVTEAIKARAAMEGIELASDKAGRSIKSAMDDGKDATNRFTGSVRNAITATKDQIEAAENLQRITSKPNGGVIKSVLTKDDMKGVDNSGLFSLQQKQQDGTLSKDDLEAAEGAFKAAAGTFDSIQKNVSGVSLDAINSSTRDYNQARDLLNKVKGLAAQDKKANDTTGVDNANLELNLNRDGLNATTSNVQNNIAQLQNLLDIAKAKDDVAEQTRLQIELDKESITLLQVKQSYANREALDLDALAAAKEKQARLQGPINFQTSAEIQSLRNQAAAKRADAKTFESDAATFKNLADIEAKKAPATPTKSTTSTAPEAAAAPSKTVNINLSINNTNIGTVDTSPAGSVVMQSFIDALQRSKLASGS